MFLGLFNRSPLRWNLHAKQTKRSNNCDYVRTQRNTVPSSGPVFFFLHFTSGEWEKKSAFDSLWVYAAHLVLADFKRIFLLCHSCILYEYIHPITCIIWCVRVCVWAALCTSICLVSYCSFSCILSPLDFRLLCDSIDLPLCGGAATLAGAGRRACAQPSNHITYTTQFYIYFMSCNRNRFVWQSHGNHIISMIFITTLPSNICSFAVLPHSSTHSHRKSDRVRKRNILILRRLSPIALALRVSCFQIMM